MLIGIIIFLKLKKTANLAAAAISFDAIVLDLWVPILYGITVCLYPNNKLLGDSLLDFIRDKQITIIPFITPSVLATLPIENKPDCLHLICAGGEIANEELMNNWLERVILINIYGPTETTVVVSYFKYRKEYPTNTIGRPCPNTQFIF